MGFSQLFPFLNMSSNAAASISAPNIFSLLFLYKGKIFLIYFQSPYPPVVFTPAIFYPLALLHHCTLYFALYYHFSQNFLPFYPCFL